MDFKLSEDQEALVDALQAILQDFSELPQNERLSFCYFNETLQNVLAQNGFLEAATSMGTLEAALVVFETAKCLSSVETIGSGLVAPLLGLDDLAPHPVALVAKTHLDKAIRNLPVAATLLVDCGEDVVVLDLAGRVVEPVTSIYAYPYGRLASVPDLTAGRRLVGKGALMRKWWRIGIAAQIAGASAAAIDFTVDYVKQRQVLGRPVGAYQSVQHRLTQRYGHAKAGYYLAMRAAWSGTDFDADCAACHAQSGIRDLLFDLHQFNGGMGVTNEYSLHFWTYRIRALQAEVGGADGAAEAIAQARWSASGETRQGVAAKEEVRA